MKPNSRGERGVALLLVLAGVVLITLLVLAFLRSASTELRSSKVYANGGNVRLLSDSVVNVVMGQIREATKTRNSSHLLTWASQPGMIRTYDDTGAAAGYYKLYSSATMAGTGAYNPAASAEQIPADWDSNSALYVDLNEPLLSQYPIVDPAAVGVVDGFAIDTTSSTVSGKSNAAPMPVQWLYVLQDGTLVVPTGSGTKATVSSATTSNPIVGRVAFWTDDESSKVNVNTASEGSFWDLPRVNSVADVQLSLNQPALNEFQRYPGHPATTSLSPVLGSLLPVSPPVNNASVDAQLAPYYTISPKISDGGSKSGTVNVFNTTTTKITPKYNRLYASVDEVQFNPDRTASSTLTPAIIELTRFFLTASSRSPDLNLFSRPRVGVWPISSTNDANHRTIWDKAIAFCTTVGGVPFYFQRSDCNSPTADLTVGNNAHLRTYLQTLATTAIPGFGGTFSTKYPNDYAQILTEIFDYVRCTNLCDNNGGDTATTYGPFVSFTNRNTSTAGCGKGQVVPIYDAASDTRGFGRFPTLSEAALVFIDGQDNFQASPLTQATEVQIKPALLLELFDPSLGFPVELGNYQIAVSGLDQFKWPDGTAMFPTPTPLVFAHKKVNATYVPVDHTRDFGGNMGFRFMLAKNTTNTLIGNLSAQQFPVGSTFAFNPTGAEITIDFETSTGVSLQTFTLKFPTTTIPVPRGVDSNNLAITQTNAGINLQDFAPGGTGRFSTLNAGPPGAWVTQFDTVRSLVAVDGDYRLVAGRRTISDTSPLFGPLTTANSSALSDYFTPTVFLSHALREATGDPFCGAFRGWLVHNALYWRATLTGAGTNVYQNPATNGNVVLAASQSGGGLSGQCGDQDLLDNGVAVGKHGSFASGDIPGDWDNGFGDVQDGPYINRPDEGVATTTSTAGPNGPYFYPENQNPVVDSAGSIFSPNRQVPSPVMFGSLPTGVVANRPWQTLLFRPDPSGRHPGCSGRAGDGTTLAGAPADHLLLDWFTMPVVEPYPISEPLSTAGRINMNYQILPFTYLNRDSGIRALLTSERLLAVDNNGTDQNANKPGTGSAVLYKQNANSTTVPNSGALASIDWRKAVDLTETLKGFQARFATGEIFRSPTEICTLPLVPSGSTYAAVSSSTTDFWYTNYPLTGDNSREKPYAEIYPRLTTKSNDFTVHYRVQSLLQTAQRAASSPTEFDTSQGDSITGEFRGSTLIERYVDPNDSTLPDYSTAALTDASKDIDSHYRFRIVSSHRFNP